MRPVSPARAPTFPLTSVVLEKQKAETSIYNTIHHFLLAIKEKEAVQISSGNSYCLNLTPALPSHLPPPEHFRAVTRQRSRVSRLPRRNSGVGGRRLRQTPGLPRARNERRVHPCQTGCCCHCYNSQHGLLRNAGNANLESDL